MAGLAIAVAGIALFLLTGSSFKVIPYNHLVAAISLTVLATVVAVPKLSRIFLVLRNRTVLSAGILLFAMEAVYGNLSLPLRLPVRPRYWTRWGLRFCYFALGTSPCRAWSRSRRPPSGGLRAANSQRSVPCFTSTVIGASPRVSATGSLCTDGSRRAPHRQCTHRRN